MIGRLSGILAEKELTACLVDVNGIGFDVAIPLSTFDRLPLPGEKVTLLIHTQVREDALTLFGFATAPERQLFRQLINISGIGGKLALNVLSAMPVEEFAAAIATGDLKTLSHISGIGKRTAERLVVELRDVIGNQLDTEAVSAPGCADAAAALETLGFKRTAVAQALKELRTELPPAEQTSENLLRQALLKLNR